MAYTTGSASTIAQLLASLISACQAAGWAWSSTDKVLSKSGAFVRVEETTYSGTPLLAAALRTSNTANDSGFVCCIGRAIQADGTASVANNSIAWPVTYYIHAIGNEVALVINYNTATAINCYQYMMFGKSSLDTGITGNKSYLTASAAMPFNTLLTSVVAGDSSNAAGAGSVAFQGNIDQAAAQKPYRRAIMHNNMDPTDPYIIQARTGTTGNTSNNVLKYIQDTMQYTPVKFNQQAVLCPLLIPADDGTKQNRSILAGQLDMVRSVRIDNFDPKQVVQIGVNYWKVYPWLRKQAVVWGTNSWGGVAGSHTGCAGFAVQYDGPL